MSNLTVLLQGQKLRLRATRCSCWLTLFKLLWQQQPIRSSLMTLAGFFVLCGGYLLGAGLHWPRFTALGLLYLLSYLKLVTSFIK